MAHNGIYATPNQVVANKNRKTKSELLFDELDTVSKSFEVVCIKLKKYLKDYCEASSQKFIDEWEIIDYKKHKDWVEIIMKDYFGDKIIRQLPADWIDNPKKYWDTVTYWQLINHINHLEDDIKTLQNQIDSDINLKNKLTESLKDAKKHLKQCMK